jgi:hypothetical protein
MRRMGAAIFAIGAMSAGLGACASAEPANAPAWYTQRLHSSERSYPALADAPHGTRAETDPAHWDAVAADVLAAREAMLANPRNAPAPVDAAQGFVDQARQDIEQTRDAH